MPTYKEAYQKAGGADKLGDYGAWEKKAKSWNKETYGTTSPTSKASKKGVTKSTLAKEHKAPGGGTTKIESKGISPTVGYGGFESGSRTVAESDALYKENKSHVSEMAGNVINETKANERMKQTIASANAPADLLTGRETRKQERLAKREGGRLERSERSKANLALKKQDKATRTKQRQDTAQRKSDLKYYKKTGIDLSA